MTIESYTTTRLELQRVATHILARARFRSTGRFGLRVSVSGLATPAFGADDRVLRIAGAALIDEQRGNDGARSGALHLPGRSLREVADFARVDLDDDFAAGDDTIAAGDIDAPLAIGAEVTQILDWYGLGARALDAVLPATDQPSVLQLWPEHFDAAFDAVTSHGRVNLGVSPGDAGTTGPYLYVGPWGQDRPGDASYWNAGFGATATRDALGDDPFAGAVAFFRRGLELLG